MRHSLEILGVSSQQPFGVAIAYDADEPIPELELLDRVKRALARWAKTPEAEAPLRSSGGEINMGDLAEIESESLKQMLAEEGVVNFEFLSPPQIAAVWHYHTVLYDRSEEE